MPTNLYRYLPTFIRLRDRVASGLTFDDTEEAVLEKIVDILAQVFDEYDDFIQELLQIQDPDTCDARYFTHISFLLGTLLPTGPDETKIRFLIKSLVSHYKTKGTHESWRTAWAWKEVERPRVVELFKSEPREVANYSAFPSAAYPLKSARIDMAVCSGVCETICESTCESICEEHVEIGEYLSRSEAENRLNSVDNLRPINVLLRRDAEEYLLQSTFPPPTETLGHYPFVYGPPVEWEGSQVNASFEDEFATAFDDVQVEVVCITDCEAACQGCCEVQCECGVCETVCQVGSCEQDCTTGCEVNCEYKCEASCQFACTACQAGGCTAACAGGCTSCEGDCADACKASCTDDCATTCEEGCQFACTNCQAGSCTATCAGGCLAGACQTGYCMESLMTTGS